MAEEVKVPYGLALLAFVPGVAVRFLRSCTSFACQVCAATFTLIAVYISYVMASRMLMLDVPVKYMAIIDGYLNLMLAVGLLLAISEAAGINSLVEASAAVVEALAVAGWFVFVAALSASANAASAGGG